MELYTVPQTQHHYFVMLTHLGVAADADLLDGLHLVGRQRGAEHLGGLGLEHGQGHGDDDVVGRELLLVGEDHLDGAALAVGRDLGHLRVEAEAVARLVHHADEPVEHLQVVIRSILYGGTLFE